MNDIKDWYLDDIDEVGPENPTEDDLDEAKKKKKVASSQTYTAGCPALNQKRFNTANGADANLSAADKKEIQDFVNDLTVGPANTINTAANPTTKGGDNTDAGNTSDSAGGESAGGLGESLEENCNDDELDEEAIFAKKMNSDVEIPSNIHIIPKAKLDDAIELLAPEEEFKVGYITPIYFYKELWDLFTLVKCTEFEGYTGVDYRDVKGLATGADETEKRIATATDQINNPDKHRGEFSAVYNKTNKVVSQGEVTGIKYGTLLYYPKVGSIPKVIYYIDIKNGMGYMKVTKDQLENTIFAKIRKELANGTLRYGRWADADLHRKVQKVLDVDDSTTTDREFSTTSGRGRAGYEQKPEVRALYTNQIYYFETADVKLGWPIIGVNESLENVNENVNLDEKRETKRYYIRPQHIFCANKADVLKALIDVSEAGENCSVYTLKNLSDHDDVHELTNDDIIYYYDDNVLYDKNHVMVMDYDLFIKHEEERTKFNRDADKVPEAEFSDEYDDRMTKATITEDIDSTITNVDDLIAKLDAGEEIILGTTNEDTEVGYINGAYYSDTEYSLAKDDNKYTIYKTYVSDEGDVSDSEAVVATDNVDEFINEVRNITSHLNHVSVRLKEGIFEPEAENEFDQEFEDVNILGEALKEGQDEEHTCCICGEVFKGHGNNAAPYKDGQCCDACNLKFVIPSRIDSMNNQSKAEEGEEDNKE